MGKTVAIVLVAALAGATMGGLAGAMAGYGFGSTSADRNQYRLAVRDGKSIFAEVQRASQVMARVQRELDRLVDDPQASSGALAALLAEPRPLDDSLFRARRYMAFQAGTVDELFRYFLGVVFIWDTLQRLEPLRSGLESADAAQRAGAQQRLTEEARSLRARVAEIVRIESALLGHLGAIAALPES
jgi:hypothetical protein